MKRLGSNAYPFNMEITHLAPPSVQLVPAKEYHGAPIGTSYDVRAYVGKFSFSFCILFTTTTGTGGCSIYYVLILL